MDREGRQDYDATTISAVPDKDGKFALHCQPFAPGKAAILRMVYPQADRVTSGFLDSTPYRYPYFVNADGWADISTSRNKLLLAPLVKAVAERDSAAADAVLMNLESLNDPFLTENATRYASTTPPRLKASPSTQQTFGGSLSGRKTPGTEPAAIGASGWNLLFRDNR